MFLSVVEIAEQAGIAPHQARWLIDRYAIPRAGKVCNGAVYHPRVLDWVKAHLDDERTTRDRCRIRTEALREFLAVEAASRQPQPVKEPGQVPA